MQGHKYQNKHFRYYLWTNEWWGISLFCLPSPYPFPSLSFLNIWSDILRQLDRQVSSKPWEKACHGSSLNGRISLLSDLHKLPAHQWQCSFVSIMSAFLTDTISRDLKHICSHNQNGITMVGSRHFWKNLKKHWVTIKYFIKYIF